MAMPMAHMAITITERQASAKQRPALLAFFIARYGYIKVMAGKKTRLDRHWSAPD
ncbi:hypothetical protein HNQ59_002550 [Chitinivorax tropicus]|uniref:Uncharacterized protein n=1 Tax=Chitinivorax tropicus TaxID=714531 RepID=A0A840MR45_9PROT|nr:hypothetical protein [Chitinivorax tropicus]